MDRRDLLKSALTLGAFSSLSAFGVRANTRSGARLQASAGFGPLSEVRDETTGLPLLKLPPGFRYLTMGWHKDPMSDGTPTPAMHDGMAAFAIGPGHTRLIRNHEVRLALNTRASAGAPVYDPETGGGTSTLDFDTNTGKLLESRNSITGTSVNCAGGLTPWGSWLTCEETMDQAGQTRASRPHGYIFEVPLVGEAEPEPLRDMGRFVHEATATDPVTGMVYETEDRMDAGFYRFTPNVRGELRKGGTLEMLAIDGQPGYDTRVNQRVGQPLPVKWLPIEHPDNPDDPDPQFVYRQGLSQGGATFGRLEGAAYNGGRIYLVATTGGNVKAGQIFAYDADASELTLVYESPDPLIANGLDNICASPRGGMIVCEDGGPNPQRLQALTRDGRMFPFAENNVVLDGTPNGFTGDFRTREFAGSTFSPDGRWLFVNAQSPGITFAITGDWGEF